MQWMVEQSTRPRSFYQLAFSQHTCACIPERILTFHQWWKLYLQFKLYQNMMEIFSLCTDCEFLSTCKYDVVPYRKIKIVFKNIQIKHFFVLIKSSPWTEPNWEQEDAEREAFFNVSEITEKFCIVSICHIHTPNVKYGKLSKTEEGNTAFWQGRNLRYFLMHTLLTVHTEFLALTLIACLCGSRE